MQTIPQLDQSCQKNGINVWQHLYVCEQLFSSMKVTKSKLRTQLNHGHLQDILLLVTSNLTSDLHKLSSQKQHKISH